MVLFGGEPEAAAQGAHCPFHTPKPSRDATPLAAVHPRLYLIQSVTWTFTLRILQAQRRERVGAAFQAQVPLRGAFNPASLPLSLSTSRSPSHEAPSTLAPGTLQILCAPGSELDILPCLILGPIRPPTLPGGR